MENYGYGSWDRQRKQVNRFVATPATRHLVTPPAPSRHFEQPNEQKKRYPGVGAGMANLGNTCYLNSVLQALGASQYLQKCRRLSPHRAECLTAARTASGATSLCVMCLLEDHFDAAKPVSSLEKSANTIVPEAIVRNLKLISPTLRALAQEDAHEFLRLLIDAMQRGYRRPPAPSPGLNSQQDGVSNMGGDGWPPKHAYPFSMFAGALQSTVVCSVCSAKSKMIDPVEDLGLEIGDGVRSVEDALNKHTKSEVLEGANCYQCDACRAKVRAHRSIQVHNVAPVVVVALKRFVFTAASLLGPSKVSTHVRFGEFLNLQPYLSPEAQEASTAAGVEKGPRAELFAVVVHQGNTVHSGHYYAYIKACPDESASNTATPSSSSKPRRWYKMNDSVVTPVDFETVQKDFAYLLFYAVPPKHQIQGASVAPPPPSNASLPSPTASDVMGPPRPPHSHASSDESSSESDSLHPHPPPVPLGTLPRPSKGFIGPAPPPPSDSTPAAAAAAAPVTAFSSAPVNEEPLRKPVGTWGMVDDNDDGSSSSSSSSSFSFSSSSPFSSSLSSSSSSSSSLSVKRPALPGYPTAVVASEGSFSPDGTKRFKLGIGAGEGFANTSGKIEMDDDYDIDAAAVAANVMKEAKENGIPLDGEIASSQREMLARQAADYWSKHLVAQAELYFSARTAAATARHAGSLSTMASGINSSSGGSKQGSRSNSSSGGGGGYLSAEAAQAAADARLVSYVLPNLLKGMIPEVRPACPGDISTESLVQSLRRSLEGDLPGEYLGPPEVEGK